LLDSYRRSFADSYENVVGRIRGQLALEPTGRPAKSTTSIIDKLQRESIRLSQMQDIAGCRLTVADIGVQDEVVAQLKGLFRTVTIVDRRQHPSHGYRAVHIIIDDSGKFVEVQIRTSLQHLWAELSEKLSDVVDGAIKYGGGDEYALLLLNRMSYHIMKLETLPEGVAKEPTKAAEINSIREETVKLLYKIGVVIPRLKGRRDDLSN
jgi:putative GTP pyrophosphokinase